MPKKTTGSNPDVAKELAALGKHVGDTLKAVASSPELKGIKNDIVKSIERVGGKMVDAVHAAQESEQTQKINKQVKKIVETSKKKGAETGERLKVNLAGGLREIGAQLSKLAERLDDR